jgi:sulfur carrier protein
LPADVRVGAPRIALAAFLRNPAARPPWPGADGAPPPAEPSPSRFAERKAARAHRRVGSEAGCIVGPSMKVILRNPGREIEVQGRRRVRELLAELHVLPETVLVIRGRDLLTVDEVVAEDDVVELRPVISGGRR